LEDPDAQAGGEGAADGDRPRTVPVPAQPGSAALRGSVVTSLHSPQTPPPLDRFAPERRQSRKLTESRIAVFQFKDWQPRQASYRERHNFFFN